MAGVAGKSDPESRAGVTPGIGTGGNLDRRSAREAHIVATEPRECDGGFIGGQPPASR
ncbi:hypothetical protein [Roseicella aquatilis]|uniref:hypothetical protein n=1 Tax=Roseicella aquatilis TaxID=2527868 RepID=UPI0014043DBE|nr:hypothetical protein [Roseicella aquatilis]